MLIVEEEALEMMGTLAPIVANAAPACEIYVMDDLSEFKTALRLAREGRVDPILRRSRTAVARALRAATKYALPPEMTSELTDRIATLSLTVMPEIAAQLETNARRKILLYKSVIRKARLMDLASGGAQALAAKAARVKVAEALTHAASAERDPVHRALLVRAAGKTLYEGRSEELPELLAKSLQAVETLLKDAAASAAVDFASLKPPHPDQVSQPHSWWPALPFMVRCPLTLAAQPNASAPPTPDLIRVEVGGERVYFLHRAELVAMGAMRPQPDGAGGLDLDGFDAAHEQVFVGDDPERFEQALHLARSRGRLEPGERADESIIRSYRDVARRYRLDAAIIRKLDAWVWTHKNGVGGATNAREEIRGLKLTKLLNPDRGDALVASALAEALVERADDPATPLGKRQSLLAKAEINLRTVLPVMLTSQSVMRMGPEQTQAVTRTLELLKKVMRGQGRESEIPPLEASVAEFARGIGQVADKFAQLGSKPPESMYA